MALTPRPLSSGTPARGLDWPAAVANWDQTTISNISVTTYTVDDSVSGAPEVGLRFQAPTSGNVAVTVRGLLRNNSSNQDRVFIAFRIFNGDPDDAELFQSDNVKYGISNSATTSSDGYHYGSQTTMVSGLTPGEWYYAQIRHRTTLGLGTADIGYRGLFIFPIP